MISAKYNATTPTAISDLVKSFCAAFAAQWRTGLRPKRAFLTVP